MTASFEPKRASDEQGVPASLPLRKEEELAKSDVSSQNVAGALLHPESSQPSSGKVVPSQPMPKAGEGSSQVDVQGMVQKVSVPREEIESTLRYFPPQAKEVFEQIERKDPEHALEILKAVRNSAEYNSHRFALLVKAFIVLQKQPMKDFHELAMPLLQNRFDLIAEDPGLKARVF